MLQPLEMGFNYMTHSPGVAETIAKDPSKWRNELDLYADMDEAKAKVDQAQSEFDRLNHEAELLTPGGPTTAPSK